MSSIALRIDRLHDALVETVIEGIVKCIWLLLLFCISVATSECVLGVVTFYYAGRLRYLFFIVGWFIEMVVFVQKFDQLVAVGVEGGLALAEAVGRGVQVGRVLVGHLPRFLLYIFKLYAVPVKIKINITVLPQSPPPKATCTSEGSTSLFASFSASAPASL